MIADLRNSLLVFAVVVAAVVALLWMSTSVLSIVRFRYTVSPSRSIAALAKPTVARNAVMTTDLQIFIVLPEVLFLLLLPLALVV